MAYQERLSGLIANASFSSTTGWTTSAFTTVGTSYRSSSSAGRGSSSSGSGSAEQTVDISSSTHLAEIDAGTSPVPGRLRPGLFPRRRRGHRRPGQQDRLHGHLPRCRQRRARQHHQQPGDGTRQQVAGLADHRAHRRRPGWHPQGQAPLRPGPHQRRHHQPVRRRLRAVALRGAPPARAHRLQAQVLYTGSLTGAVRVSRAAVEVCARSPPAMSAGSRSPPRSATSASRTSRTSSTGSRPAAP